MNASLALHLLRIGQIPASELPGTAEEFYAKFDLPLTPERQREFNELRAYLEAV